MQICINETMIFKINTTTFEAELYKTEEIQRITIPKSIIVNSHEYVITNIQEGSLVNVSSITFHPDSKLQKIKQGVFNSTHIREITIPAEVDEIESNAFYGCKYLKIVNFAPNSKVISLGAQSFMYTNIKDITIPSNCKKIGDYCFVKCPELETVNFCEDSKLEYIGSYAFCECKITSITIPSNVKILSESCFNGSKLELVAFARNSQLLNIEDYAFAHTKIKSITIPSSVKKIGFKSFAIPTLTTIVFPENSQLELIDDYAFDTTKITELYIPPKTKFTEKFLIGMNNLLNIFISPENNNLKCINNQFIVTKSNQEIDSFDKIVYIIQKSPETIIPSNYILCREALKECFFSKFILASDTKMIKNSCFYGFNIEKIVIPPSVERIEQDAFNSCNLNWSNHLIN